ncbi:MAG: ComEC/Rec2 family competence protein [bacterium]|nr:ComEC/Rec2 family competence protein [bacterium]
MVRPLLLALILWLLLFAFRIVQIGGLDLTYREERTELLQPLRQTLTSTVDKILPYPQSVLLSGILIGADKNMPWGLKKDLQTTSTIHMVVVSGQNLSMVAGFIMSLVYLVGRKRAIALTLLAVTFYSLLTGLQVPVIRAAIMVFFSYFAQILGRERQGFWILCLTAGLMLLYNPQWILSVSFQLSFAATLGVTSLAPLLLGYLQKIPRFFREDLAVTVAAQILTLPFIVYNFQQLSLLGVLTNILVLWTIPLVMVGGFLSLVLGLVSNFLGQLFGLFPAILLTYYIYIVEFFARIPITSLKVGETGVIVWVGYYLLVGGIVWSLKIKTDKLLKELK